VRRSNHGQPPLGDGVERHEHSAQVLFGEVLDLVDDDRDARLGGLGSLPDGHQQRREIDLEVPAVRLGRRGDGDVDVAHRDPERAREAAQGGDGARHVLLRSIDATEPQEDGAQGGREVLGEPLALGRLQGHHVVPELFGHQADPVQEDRLADADRP
jgi:hypothetical protein